MVIWNKFKSNQDIAKQVPMVTDGKSGVSNYTQDFLVYWRFEKSKGDFQIGNAHLIKHENGGYSLMVNGVIGKVEVSHYAILNPPSDLRIKVKISKPK